MKKVISVVLAALVIAASIVTVTSFFKPWANVDTSVTGVAKEVSGFAAKLPFAQAITQKIDTAVTAIRGAGVDVKIKTVVTGYSIPILVNNKTSRVALSLAQILFKSTEGLEWKSCLVYLLPIFGVTCAVFAVIGLKLKIAVLLMTITSGLISGVGLHNLKSVDISSEMVQVTIEKGLWDTMYAFLFTFGIGILWFIVDFALGMLEKRLRH